MYAANCSTRSSSTVTKSAYDDFAVPTNCRKARIVVGGKSLYVNAGWLAELSPFFAKHFFAEAGVNELLLTADISYEDMLELMRVVFYCPTRKPITVTNVAAILRLASQFSMKAVVDRCQDVIARGVDTLDKSRLLEVTQVLSQCERNSLTMSLIVDKLSKLSEGELSTFQFSQMPGDVVADVYAAKMKRSTLKNDRCCCM